MSTRENETVASDRITIIFKCIDIPTLISNVSIRLFVCRSLKIAGTSLNSFLLFLFYCKKKNINGKKKGIKVEFFKEVREKNHSSPGVEEEISM
jgi:hypothetical protein